MPERNHFSKITIPLPSEVASRIAYCLEPELGRIKRSNTEQTGDYQVPASNRLEVSINVQSNNLILSIDAADISALQAGLNSYLRWIQLSLQINDLVSVSHESPAGE